MGRVYRRDGNGDIMKRPSGVNDLILITCDGRTRDGDRCPATLRPGPDVAKSGWTKHGRLEDTSLEWDYCERCS